MRTLRPILILSVALAAAFAMAACGSSSDETQTNAPAGATTAPETTTAPGTTTAPPASTSTTPEGGAPVGVRAKACKGASGAAVEIRVTGISCAAGRSTVAAWSRDESCSSPTGSSRTSCKVGKLTCLGAATDRGVAVTCAGVGRSVSFVAGRG